jgi:hypothetical protein
MPSATTSAEIARSLQAERLQLNRRRAAQIILRMRRENLLLQVSFERKGRRWWLSDNERVPDPVAQCIVCDDRVVGVNDSLFGGGVGLSQTFRYAD